MKKMFVSLAIASLSVLSVVRATTITEDFSTEPSQGGWQIFGDTNLFQWDSTNHNLAVTWDSAQPNSFFHHSLGTTLTRSDDFSLEFDLFLADIISGNEPGKTGGMEISIGFLNLASATNTSFMRAASPPNLVEFDYFPAGYFDFGGIFPVDATTTPTFISTNSAYAPKLFAPYIFELPVNQTIHVTMAYTASNQTLVTILKTNDVLLTRLLDVVLDDPGNSSFGDTNDFRVDTVSITSYSSVGDDFDSVLAHGSVDNLVVTVPPPPVLNFTGTLTNNIWQAQFVSRSNWLYTLERTTDLQAWTDISPETPGSGTDLSLQDTNAPVDKGFYRVRASRP